jgi:PAS domain S-box-containing protein
VEPGDRLLMKGDASLRAAATPARGHGPSSAAHKSADRGFEATPINILLVDDESKNLTALETVLDDPRYQLIRAESADEALLFLVKEEFALIVLDIHMPGMSGFELAQLIKQRKKTATVPIIFLTAYYSEDQHVMEGYETGAVDYLHKPINPTILRSKVAVFAELYMKSREIEAANRALVEEITERRRVQQELLLLNDDLERRVEERAADLLQANLALSNSEERLRLAQTAGGVGVWDWQSSTGGIWWSDSMWTIYGAHPVSPNEVEDLWRSTLHPEDRPRVEEEFAALLADGDKTSLRDEFRITWPSGEVRWVEFIARLERDGAGHPLRMLGVNADITERKRLEENLRQVAEELSESDRRKDQFLAMLAHELRNPLAPIRNAVEILRLMPDHVEAVQSATTLMDRQIAQMVRLVDDLLDVSRISRGKIELRMSQLELVSAISEVVESVRPMACAMKHALTASLPSEPITLTADPTRLAQLVGNLLHNACKFTPPGGQISVRVERDDRHASICVTDSGVGIAPEQLSRIFEMFVQGDTSLERAQSGLGIGLTLVKQLAEMHGGTVDGRSAGQGLGSEFTVRLPLHIHQPAKAVRSPVAGGQPFKVFGRILVVDDNRDSAESLALLLKSHGNTIATAYDGLHALEVGAAFHPDVVLLDIGLPKLNGYDTARRIREEKWGRDVVLVALTGWGKDEDRRRSSEAGFNSHLVKPVEFERLVGLLADLQSAR